MKKDVLGRIQSGDDRQFHSAFFEIYLNQLLKLSGFQVTPHPKIEGNRNRPDFLVLKDERPLFYLEATVIVDGDVFSPGKSREDEFKKVINRGMDPRYALFYQRNSDFPKKPLPAKRIRAFLKEKLAALDYDQICEIAKVDSQRLPKWKYECEGWSAEFSPIPKKRSGWGTEGDAFGMEMGPGGLLNYHVDIRRAIHDKNSKYGALNLPYIIAINVIDDFGFANWRSVNMALFGDFQIIFERGGGKTTQTRARNGVWSPTLHTRNSAVMMFLQLHCHNVSKRKPLLCHNPWTSKKLDEDIWPLRQVFARGDRLKLKKGRTQPHAIFGFPRSWPQA